MAGKWGGRINVGNNRAIALINSSHPIPCLAVSSFAGLFAFGSGIPWDRSLLIFLVVLFQQISVGQSNDWLDYKKDVIAGRTDKPAVNGTIRLTELRAGALIAAILAQSTSFLFGATAALVMFGMLTAGWAYNLGMKSNWSSAIPYAVGFGLIPIFVGQAALVPVWVPIWVVLVAALLGVAAHFANVLPDFAADKLTGVNSLPHILGQKLSALVIATTAIVATILVITQSTDLDPSVAGVGLVFNILIVGLATALSLWKTPPRAAFLLLILASLVNVFLLVLGSNGF